MEKHPIDYLILVNPFHKIPEDFVDNLELIEMKGYDDEVFRVEKEAARQFCGLQAAAAEKGIEILLSSAYRSVEKQRAIKEEFTAEYGVDYAKRYVAEPGCSEHHTGLALDFVAKIGGKWLIENDEIHRVSGGAVAHSLCRGSGGRGGDRGAGDYAGGVLRDAVSAGAAFA